MQKLKLICLTWLIIGMIACSKENDVKPEPEKPTVIVDTILTEEKLIGKWEVTDVQFIYMNNGIETGRQKWLKNYGYFDNGQKRKSWDPAKDASYITFTTDHKFSHINPDGQLNSYMLIEILSPEGNWSITDVTKLKLTTDFGDDSLDVDWNYRLTDRVLQIDYEQNEIWSTGTGTVIMKVLLEKQ